MTFLTLKRALTLISITLLSVSCGVQSIPQAMNDLEAKSAEVQNQYKRRADLIPNLVNTVKGYASHEKDTLDAVVSARARASQVNIGEGELTQAKLDQYTKAQSSLTSALGRLMVVVEKYPDLKADQNFRDLQHQLEGTENRITVARNRYIESIQNFNNLVTVPPTSWTNALLYKHEKHPQYSVPASENVEVAPKVEF